MDPRLLLKLCLANKDKWRGVPVITSLHHYKHLFLLVNSFGENLITYDLFSYILGLKNREMLWRESLSDILLSLSLCRNAIQIKYFRNHFQSIEIMPGRDDVMMRNKVIYQALAVWYPKYGAI